MSPKSTFDYLSFPREGRAVAVMDARATPGHGVATTTIHVDGAVQKVGEPRTPPREQLSSKVERWWSVAVLVIGLSFLLVVAYRRLRQQ